MPASKELQVKIEITGQEPNLKPAASAFVRVLQKITNQDGTFIDPDLETEFQEWIKAKAGKEIA